MKRVGISLSITFLAMLLLLGSGGFTIGKMICGGNACASTYTLGKAKDCCSSEKATSETQLKSCCCELVDVSYSLDDFSVSEKVNISAEIATCCLTTLDLVFHLPSAYILQPSTDTSPPDPRGYLYFIGSLLL